MYVKIISLDMDGTLLSSNFDGLIWDELIPQVYAKNNNISLEEAKEFFKIEYSKDLSKLGCESKDWFDVSWWIKEYKLKTTWEDLWKKAHSSIFVFEDVKETIKELKKLGYKLIITTGASKSFIDVKLKNCEIKELFDEIFSVSDTFNLHNKDSLVYETICEKYDIKPFEMLHVGDDYRQDFLSPKSIGVQSLFLDRTKQNTDELTIHSLKEIIEFVKK